MASRVVFFHETFFLVGSPVMDLLDLHEVSMEFVRQKSGRFWLMTNTQFESPKQELLVFMPYELNNPGLV